MRTLMRNGCAIPAQCVTVADMDTTAYAARAATKYLEAYARQDGRARTVACGMTWHANQLGKAVNALRLELPGTPTTWWGERYRLLAVRLTTTPELAQPALAGL